ncbi:MAG: hypothetical protein EBU97_00570 [Rhodobacteraceae bacterium]|nr:hypothetical protein [Paracoccaceae bacterium]
MTAATLEARLAALAAMGQTIHYGALARDLGWRMAALTAALEDTIRQDLAHGRPLRAALVTSRLTSDMPAPGFWEILSDHGVGVADPRAFIAGQREMLRAASD